MIKREEKRVKKATRVPSSRFMNKQILNSKRSQVSAFIIIAIVIVAAVGVYFLLRGRTGIEIPKDIKPIFSYYDSCVEDNIEGAINLVETQGGYIYLPEFERGNELYPSSSQLDFFGFGVPYWSYISISGARKEQVPSKSEIENQISSYLASEIKNCDFSEFRERGFEIERGEIRADTKINLLSVEVSINEPLAVKFGDISEIKEKHKVSVSSKLGKFYDIAKTLYSKEKNEKFLENYGLDVLRNYAPVDGVELSCSPKIWNPEKVTGELLQATEANVLALRARNNNYKLSKKENKYFVVDYNADENIGFFYSPKFPTKVEIWPVENDIMIAEPVGNQQGLGILGFCYVPYHFVYDFVYPVLIQVSDEKESFQFPVIVSIEKNQVSKRIEEAVPEPDLSLCKYKNTEISVYTYNTRLEPVEANISFECLGEECRIGETKTKDKEALLLGKFPECGNGFVVAKANNYAVKRQLLSTNEEFSANLILDREYELELNMTIAREEMAIVSFDSEKTSFTLVYPEQKKLKLSEGYYNISVFRYKNSTIYFPSTSDKKCVKMAKSGLLGFLGGTEERCFDINIPSQTITFALSGGGSLNKYFVESELESSKQLIIESRELKTPSSLEELQNNYIQLEENKLRIEAK